jgi:hypothetical protein
MRSPLEPAAHTFIVIGLIPMINKLGTYHGEQSYEIVDRKIRRLFNFARQQPGMGASEGPNRE